MSTVQKKPSPGHAPAFALCLMGLIMIQTPAWAWGANGHRVVGSIAEQHLSPETATAVQALLGPDTLAEVSTWPDDIRSDDVLGRNKGPWHFVTVEDDQTIDQVAQEPGENLLERIRHFTEVLEDPEAAAEDRYLAVVWLTHLVGDIHQPLHVGRGDDQGGNRILVLWHGEPSNLHSVWDSSMIEQTGLSFSELVAFLDPPTPDQIKAWQSSGPRVWAQESFYLRDEVYDLGNRRLEYRYSYVNLPIVEHRLLQAGVRLAGLLNRTLGNGSD